jgi:hypothetical protein
MRSISKSAIVTGAGVVLLGASLALSSAGVSGASQDHAAAGHAKPAAKAKTCDTNGFCLSEQNEDGAGGAILGDAVNDGVGGVVTNDYGVYGSAQNEFGVYGYAPTYGIFGQADDYGVYGEAVNYGLFGVSSGAGTSGIGVYAEAANTGGAFPLWAQGEGNGSGYFSVDSYGDGVFTGFVQAIGGYTEVIRMNDGTRANANVALAPRATIEDTGTARMNDGVAAVHFENDFARSLDVGQGYQVFLTPDGETRGLYVAQKYEGGFIVRENDHGRSSVYFDYRIVAHPAGSSAMRFPAYAPLRRPHPPQPPAIAPHVLP